MAKKFSIKNILPKVPLKLLVLCFIITLSSSFQYGFSTTYVNTAQASFMNYINESLYHKHHEVVSEGVMTWTWAVVVNSVQVGIIIGTLIVPFMAEKFGRRWSLLASILPETCGILLSAIAIPLQMPLLLCLGRLSLAVAVGINFTVATLFVQEISPTHARGFLSSFLEFSLCISTITGLVVGLPSVLGCETCLIYLTCVGLIGPVLRIVLVFCPDTPKYLFLRRHDTTKACHSIKFYHGPDVNLTNVLEELKKEGNLESQAPDGQSNNSFISKIKGICNDWGIRKALLIGTVTYMSIQASGIIPIYEFSTYILVDTGLNYKLADMGTILMSLLNTVFTVVSMNFVDRLGRRKLLLFGLSGLAICLVTFMAFDIVHKQLGVSWAGYGSMVCLIMHSIIYSTGPGPICWFITAELVPQHLRSSAQAFTQLLNQIVDLIISSVFFPAYTSIGPYSFLILFIIPLICCIVYLYLELPETKNREISDIVLDMKLKHKKNTFVEKF